MQTRYPLPRVVTRRGFFHKRYTAVDDEQRRAPKASTRKHTASRACGCVRIYAGAWVVLGWATSVVDMRSRWLSCTALSFSLFSLRIYAMLTGFHSGRCRAPSFNSHVGPTSRILQPAKCSLSYINSRRVYSRHLPHLHDHPFTFATIDIPMLPLCSVISHTTLLMPRVDFR